MQFIKIIISVTTIGLGLSNFCAAAMLHPTTVQKFKDPKVIDELNNLIKTQNPQSSFSIPPSGPPPQDPIDFIKKTTWQVDINTPGSDGRYPIHEAVLADNLPLVKNS